MLHRFPKSERLCNQIQIQAIFKDGKAIKSYPFLFIYLSDNDLITTFDRQDVNKFEDLSFHTPAIDESDPIDSPGLVQVVVSVSSKKHKSAVVRNRIKRKIRELYRYSKPLLIENKRSSSRVYLVLLYMSGKEHTFNEMRNAFREGITKLKHEIK